MTAVVEQIIRLTELGGVRWLSAAVPVNEAFYRGFRSTGLAAFAGVTAGGSDGHSSPWLKDAVEYGPVIGAQTLLRAWRIMDPGKARWR